MEHADHVALLRRGAEYSVGGVWADFGAGTGAFTLALAELIGEGTIYAIDRDASALKMLERAMTRYPAITLHTRAADFTGPIELPPLDGALMANALHFVRDKNPVLARIVGYLRPGGRLLMVEYEADRGNPWVPYPFSYATWARMASSAGLTGTRQLASRPSRFLNAIYAAVSIKPETATG